MPFFRNHLTRTTGAMLPSHVNTVAQAERERRDSHLSVSVTDPGCRGEKGALWFWGCQSHPTCDPSVEGANPGRQQ